MREHIYENRLKEKTHVSACIKAVLPLECEDWDQDVCADGGWWNIEESKYSVHFHDKTACANPVSMVPVGKALNCLTNVPQVA